MHEGSPSAPFRGRRRAGVPGQATRRWRRGGPFAVFAVLCVAVLIAVLTGATKPLANTQFALTGHWVYNSLLQNVFHIDGATANIDAQLPVTTSPGSQVVQGDTSGFVVSPTTITEFSKSTLSVQQTLRSPVDEVPLGVEAEGGPYLVYRNAGKIVRLGDPQVAISADGPVGDPLVTADGTMWLHHTETGLICTLKKDATRISGCPVAAPKDHPGALTLIGDRVAFVDMFTGQVHTIDHNTLGPGAPLGVPVSPDSRPATHDLAGRVVLLDPERHSLVVAGGGKPVTIALPGGDYDGPVSTGSSVVLVDRQSGTVLTFGPKGQPEDAKPIEHAGGQPRLSQGEDNRVYVENPNGTRVLIIAGDGKVKDVPVTPKPVVPTPSPATSTGQPIESRPTTEPTVQPTGQHEPVPPPTTARPPVAVPPSAPGAPTLVSATPGDTTATVTWGAAADNRSPIITYQVSWRGSNGQAGSVTVSGGSRQVPVNGLTDGVGYVFTVIATNQVGTGPGVATATVTPFAAASAPSPTAGYQSGTATVNWAAPDLRGGTLLNYLVSATGQADRSVAATTTSYTGFAAGQTVTFTVRAVTRAPGGQTLTGAPGSASVTVPAPKITIAHGASTTSANCHAPDCAFVNATMTGFAPNTTFPITLSSDSNPNVATESFTTDANGNAPYNQLDYDSPGQTVWIVVNGVSSNQIVWP